MKSQISNQFIREIKLIKDNQYDPAEYPYNIKSIKTLSNLILHPKVTFIIGENGSGKSTLLEAVAVAYGFNPEGGSKNFNFETNPSHSILYENIKLIKGVLKPKTGYFFRAESFYNVASEIDKIGSNILAVYGGKSLHQQSHGESFLSLFMNRFVGNGIYILDEPEAALSPERQMAFLANLHNLAKDNCQFIIATHSPIIMAYPDAVIYNVDDNYEKIDYKYTSHYNTTKEFLNNTDRMLNILMNE